MGAITSLLNRSSPWYCGRCLFLGLHQLLSVVVAFEAGDNSDPVTTRGVARSDDFGVATPRNHQKSSLQIKCIPKVIKCSNRQDERNERHKSDEKRDDNCRNNIHFSIVVIAEYLNNHTHNCTPLYRCREWTASCASVK